MGELKFGDDERFFNVSFLPLNLSRYAHSKLPNVILDSFNRNWIMYISRPHGGVHAISTTKAITRKINWSHTHELKGQI